MAWTSPRTWVASAVLTAAQLNVDVRDNELFLYTPPMCRAYQSSTTENLATATTTAITFDSEDYDTDSMHSTVSNTDRVTATTAGKYVVTGGIVWAGTGTDGRKIYLYHNNTTIIAGSIYAGTSSGSVMSCAGQYAAAATDYFQNKGEQNSGGNLSVSDTTHKRTFLAAAWQGN